MIRKSAYRHSLWKLGPTAFVHADKKGYHVVTVADCLALPDLSSVTLIAGRNGLNRPVRLAHVIDEPDILSWVAPEILVLTTGHNHPPDTGFWVNLIRGLANHGVAGLMVALGRYLPALPPIALKEADQLCFPIISVPWLLPFVKVTEAVHRLIIQEHAQSWSQVAELEVRVAEATVHAKTLDHLLKTFSRLIGRPVKVDKNNQEAGVSRFSLPSPDLSHWELTVGPPELSEPESIVARQMAGVLAIWLLQQKIAMRSHFEAQAALFDRLLSGQWEDSPVARQRLRMVGVLPERSYRLLLLTLPDPLTENASFQSEIFEEARTLLANHLKERISLITTHPLGLLLLLDIDARAITLLESVTRLFFARFPSSVGVISPHCMIAELPNIKRTLAQIVPLLSPGVVHDMSDALFPAIVVGLPDDLMQSFVASTWERVTDPSLEKTLKALVAVGGHRSDAAQLLGVHRNTITNRVEQIETLLGRPLTPGFLGQLDLAHQWMQTKGHLPPKR